MADRLTEILEVARIRRATADGSARGIRESAGVSLAEVAAAAGVSKGTISKWERGLSAPRAALALRYGKVLAGLRSVDR